MKSFKKIICSYIIKYFFFSILKNFGPIDNKAKIIFHKAILIKIIKDFLYSLFIFNFLEKRRVPLHMKKRETEIIEEN